MMRELLLPVGVLAAIASMLIPLPPAVLDFLLVTNLLLGVVLLVNTLFLTEPLKLSSLPTLLLLATLFRLALNVSTTRLILSRGEAGQTVEAFGEVVMQGSLIIGVVVFLVITMVQFIVIAKGAERVAEVAARFTLDALPGKQMSIDADVRAGILSFDVAREKRNDLQAESRFYGALDGAMKFIKGDAIAGLVIIVINLCGGFLVGSVVQGLDIAAAAQRYTVLTIGDGLVSQIPALLNALAAGIVVTRVVRGDGRSLSRDIISQLGQIRLVKLLIAFVAAILAMVPGMPTFPFSLLAFLFFLSAFRRSALDLEQQQAAVERFLPRIPAPLAIELPQGPELAARLKMLEKVTPTLRRVLYEERGLLLREPEITLVTAESPLRILMKGVPALTFAASPSQQLDGNALLAALKTLCMERSTELCDDGMTRRVLDHAEKENPELVAATIPALVSAVTFGELLRALLVEGVTIRNVDLILQSVAEVAPRLSADRTLLEEVRISLRRVITNELLAGRDELRLLTIQPGADLLLSEPTKRESLDVVLMTKGLVAEIIKRVQSVDAIVVLRGSRKFLRDALAARGCALPVLSFDEIAHESRVRFVEEIATPEGAERIVEKLAA